MVNLGKGESQDNPNNDVSKKLQINIVVAKSARKQKLSPKQKNDDLFKSSSKRFKRRQTTICLNHGCV